MGKDTIGGRHLCILKNIAPVLAELELGTGGGVLA